MYDAMGEDSKKVIQSKVMKTAKEVYLACLFILVVNDERYGGVKTALGDNYLLGKQEYPQDLLAAKRLLADFKGAPSKTGGISGRRERGGVHPHLPRLRQEVQRRLAKVQAHHRGPQGQDGSA